MTRGQIGQYLELSTEAEEALIAGARDAAPVTGLTHDFYKYPARFSPVFARAAIEAFTQPGDVCLDPHVGGGTTLVEALALGRKGIGVDVSTLAEFVATVKTLVFSPSELARLETWAREVGSAIDARKTAVHRADYAELGYYKHLNHPSRWRLRKAIDQALDSAVKLRSGRLEAFGRCVVLRTAQWALDGRKTLPDLAGFRRKLETTATAMLSGARAFGAAVSSQGMCLPEVEILQRSAAGIETDDRLQAWTAPKLVVTSPPYPGVHVLYHRWQVDGRKETAFPFMIANKLDGAGGSFYTMGDRHHPELKTYFNNIRATMSSVAALASDETIIAQMVAFSDVSWQLPKYLQTMQEAGLTEVKLRSLREEGDGRLWRNVPGRRWYSHQRGATPASKEVVLLHRKAPASH